MEKQMTSILNDLYRVDPELRKQEARLKKIIEELLKTRPSAQIDSDFQQELRRRLLAVMADKPSRKPFTLFSLLQAPAWRIALSAAMTLAVIAGVGFYLNPLQKKQSFTLTSQPESLDKAVVTDKKHKNKPVIQQERLKKEEKILPGDADAGLTAPAEALVMEDNAQPQRPFTSDAAVPPAMRRSVAKQALKNEAVLGEAEKSDDLAVIRNPGAVMNREGYAHIQDNPFFEAAKDPLSTFSIDVDTASYANIRRMISGGTLPPAGAVRIEEMVNYFPYNYEAPSDGHPLAFNPELSVCPWNSSHYLLRVGLQAARIDTAKLPPNNLVFLLDVSGSMEDPNKLPLVREAMKLLVRNMRAEDRISIVVYAGAAGEVLPTTSGRDKGKIMRAIDNLSAGGSTAGGEGIILAYNTAQKNRISDGNNRVILATDGDFNVGQTSDSELVSLIEEKRRSGIYLTVLGFGNGNYQDAKMELLADKGNGNFAYIDSLDEARKVLVNEAAGTLLTVADDVKLQLEFNPARVAQYRLIGYENRVMAARDFEDDTKDAGELGAGHTVTAFYEIIPAESPQQPRPLKYQKVEISQDAASSNELMTIHFRYKKPGQTRSVLMTVPVPADLKPWNDTSTDYRFAAAVAEWGLLLRNSPHKGNASLNHVLDTARDAKGQDPEKYRAGFVDLVKKSQNLLKENQ